LVAGAVSPRLRKANAGDKSIERAIVTFPEEFRPVLRSRGARADIPVMVEPKPCKVCAR